MNSPLLLHVSERSVTSPFGLLGTDENALSFSLGYTFQQCPPLMQWFLKRIGIMGIRSSMLRKAGIKLQQHRSGEPEQGITDIEIHLPGHFRIIIEAKVGLAVPTIAQCRKYLPRFHQTNEPIQKLVALVQSPDKTFQKMYAAQDRDLSERLVCLNWSELFPACIRIMQDDSIETEIKEWVRSFYRFLDQEYEMKAFSTEVWILSVSTKPLWKNGMSHWDIHKSHRVWWAYNEHSVRPLYFAFRVEGNLDSIWRVSRIEHDVPIIEVVSEMRHMKKQWPKVPCTIWHLEPPVKLPKSIRTGAGMYNRRVRCDLDLLLSCETVLEIEKEMKKRREKAPA